MPKGTANKFQKGRGSMYPTDSDNRTQFLLIFRKPLTASREKAFGKYSYPIGYETK